MLEKLFKDALKLSEQLRPQYPKSLGNKSNNWENVFKQLNVLTPELFRTIYSNVSGTKRDITEQTLMDFTPGYRLIHISEFIQDRDTLKNIITDESFITNEIVLPILTNYSSDYICYYKKNTGEELVCSVMSDFGELIVMYSSPEKFLETICEFYKQGVYFLDSDGYLEYDMSKEGVVGSEINSGIKYWME